MLEISRRVKGERRVFRILTEAEAKAEGLAVRPWRECEAGDWALSDDGYVGECLEVRSYKKGRRERKFFKLSYAYVWGTDPKPLSFEERYRTRSWARTAADTWIQAELKKGRAKRVIEIYAQMLVNGRKIDWGRLAQIYRPNQLIPEATVRRLFRQKEVKLALREEVENCMRQEGITEKYVLRSLRKALEMAEAKGDGRAMHDISTTFAEFLQMYPKQQKVIQLEAPPPATDIAAVAPSASVPVSAMVSPS